MKNCLLVLSILSISLFTFAQGELSDEFEIQEPAAETNSSKTQPFDLTTTPENNPASPDDGTVLVRERREELAPQVSDPNQLVEIRTAQDVFLPYKQRQNSWGFLFSIGTEQHNFPGYLTQVGVSNGDNYNFSDLFGNNPVNLFNVETGPKYNTRVGSFAVLVGYGTIYAKSSHVGSLSKFTMQRYSATAVYYLDTFFSEPYFIPYVAGGMWQADMRETSASYPNEVGKFSTKPGTQYRFGALLGLDWIEGDAARASRRKNGTQGTFLNIYAVTTTMSESNPDPDLGEAMALGASLVVEF